MIENDEDKDLEDQEGFEPLEVVSEEGDELSCLEAALAEKTAEAADNYEKFLRATADLNNVRKRLEKEKSDYIAYGNEGLMKQLLSVVDNLERALEHADTDNTDSLREGLTLVSAQLISTLESFGLRAIEAEGLPFDPNRHEAISHDDSEGHEPGFVIKVFQKGYFFKDRLLRPSMVSVAKN